MCVDDRSPVTQKKVSPTKKLKASVALSVMSTGQNRKKGQEFFALFTEKAPSIRDVKPPRTPYNCSKFVNSSTSTFALFTFSHSFPQNFYVDKKIPSKQGVICPVLFTK